MNEKSNLSKLIIKHENSQNESCLQVLDFISWAIFRNYEHKDSRFFEIINWSLLSLFETVFEYRWKYWENRNLRVETKMYDLAKGLVIAYYIISPSLYVIGMILLLSLR